MKVTVKPLIINLNLPEQAGLPEPKPVGAGVFGWSRSRNFRPALTPTPTLQYFKYFVFTGPKYDYDNDDYDYDNDNNYG